MINLIFLCFSFGALAGLGAFVRTKFLCISVLRVATGHRVKLVNCKSSLNPLVLVLLCCFVVYSTRRFVLCQMSYLVSFCSCIFSPFSIAISWLGKERANLSAFRTFVRFVLVWISRFPLPLGVWEGLRFVIVAHPRLFSYIFFLFYSTDRSKAVVPVLVLLFVALWFTLRGD